MSDHDLLLLHASTTLVLAGTMWALQLGLVPLLRRATPEHWPRHAAAYRTTLVLLFWPLVALEACSGILLALGRPLGIPSGLHVANLVLIGMGWTATLLIRIAVGHALLARFDPEGVARFARLNWVRLAIWTARAALVVLMLHLAHTAAVG